MATEKTKRMSIPLSMVHLIEELIKAHKGKPDSYSAEYVIQRLSMYDSSNVDPDAALFDFCFSGSLVSNERDAIRMLDSESSEMFARSRKEPDLNKAIKLEKECVRLSDMAAEIQFKGV